MGYAAQVRFRGVFQYHWFYHSTLMQNTVTVAAPGTCEYSTGDCNHNGAPPELGEAVAEIGIYRGTAEAPGCADCPGL